MQVSTVFVDVILPLPVPNLFTYRVPQEMNEFVQPGIRVVVQFGKNKLYTAIIRSVHHRAPADYTAKYIEAIVDDQPVVNALQFEFWDWICFYYLCFPGEVMNVALPVGLKLSSETKINLNPDFDFSDFDVGSLSAKENSVFNSLLEKQNASLQDLNTNLKLKNIQSVISSLRKKKLILLHEEMNERFKPRLVSYVKLNPKYLNNESEFQQLVERLEKRALKQLEALLFYLSRVGMVSALQKKPEIEHWVKKADLTSRFDNSPVQSLIKKGAFDYQEFEISRLKMDQDSLHEIKLSELQQTAYASLIQQLTEKSTVLLHGITGSGKTEIYIQLIKDTLANEKQVLLLVPEIALTTQLIYRVRKYVGGRVGVYHSKFSENERVEIWNSIAGQVSSDETLNQNQNYDVVLGTRSALFLPFSRLGLIIVDEEHDPSYKQQDNAPRYHARDAAIYLAQMHKAKVVLGTATPSLETYFNAKQHRFGLVTLTSRFGGAELPEIQLVDSRGNEATNASNNIFTKELKDAVQSALTKKEQVILFQNRRGFAPYTECNTCNWIPQCVQCDVSLIFHKSSSRLICHYCGYSIQPPSTCNACGNSDLRYKGLGTEKIEEVSEILFPGSKIARMDVDSTRSKYAYRQLLDDFEQHKIDVLIGTQMVTKGLDFEHVNLVGVMNADQQLNFPDFRSSERAYQLLTQVAGRAGRRQTKGKVIIQTTKVNHEVLKQVKDDCYELFYQQQINDRKEFNYPPFYRLIDFTFISVDLHVLNDAASWFTNELRTCFPEYVLGPEYPLISKIRNEFYKKTLLKTERNFSVKIVREKLNQLLYQFKINSDFRKVRIKIDVDPV